MKVCYGQQICGKTEVGWTGKLMGEGAGVKWRLERVRLEWDVDYPMGSAHMTGMDHSDWLELIQELGVRLAQVRPPLSGSDGTGFELLKKGMGVKQRGPD